MAILESADVKSGKVVPKPGDTVDGYAYVSGDPRANASYKPLEGMDYFHALPTARQAMVNELLIGKMKYPTLSRNNPWAQQLVTDAAIVDKNFDQNAYKVRSDMYHDFTVGPTSKIINALNQAPLHAKELAGAYDQLHNLPVGGGIGHWINNSLTSMQSLTNTGQQAATGAFNASQPAVADELATLYKGSSGTIPGITAQEDAFPMGAPPAESNNALKTASKLMADRLKVLETRWRNGMGPTAGMFPIVSPDARNALTYLNSRYNPAPTPQALPRKGGPAKVGRFTVEPVN